MVKVSIGRGLTWACHTDEAARVVASVFAGDYAASPRATRRVVPWSSVTRSKRIVPSYAERTAKRRGSVAARVGRYQ